MKLRRNCSDLSTPVTSINGLGTILMLVIAVSNPPASVLVLIEPVVLPPKLPTDS